MKLLSKNAEVRYQSAAGLKADLERCLTQLQTIDTIADFLPGQLDKSGQLSIPQKLYGREREVETLLAAFERVSGQWSVVTPPTPLSKGGAGGGGGQTTDN
jgi:hypothetical protein